MQPKRPREDDVVECQLYPRFCYSLNPDEITEDMLRKEIEKYQQDTEVYVKDYLWHRDNLTFLPKVKQALQFECVSEGKSKPTDFELIPHIQIVLRFDEDVGDEWFLVFLIINLTKKHEGLIARMEDSDGEFLLIEAADEIPHWASPETCEKRVFLMNGSIHVIQDKHHSRQNILNSIYQRSHIFKLADKVQAIIHKKISIYPEELEKRKHKARAYLPEKAAYILHKKPELISAAIRTVCHSDPIERQVCRAMRYFPPEQRVMTNVKMTKCLYAMAVHCRYTGDPRTGWNLPTVNNPKYNSYLLGIKIACGLEMLISEAQERRKKRTNDRMVNQAACEIETDPGWPIFLQRLEASGYFKDLLDGSQERESLMSNAKIFYRDKIGKVSKKDDELPESEQLFQAYENIQNQDVDHCETEEISTLSPEDSDSWLNVTPDQLELMLSQKFDISGKPSEQPLALGDKVSAFINQKSGIEGVQFYSDKDLDVKSDTEDNGRIDFDPEVFDTALRDILDLVVPGGDGEFDGSSEGSLGGDEEDQCGEMDKYMKLLDSQLQQHIVSVSSNETVETNLLESIEEEAGGSGPIGNILGGPIERLKHLKKSNDAEKGG